MGLMYVRSHCQLCGMLLYPEDGGSSFLQNVSDLEIHFPCSCKGDIDNTWAVHFYLPCVPLWYCTWPQMMTLHMKLNVAVLQTDRVREITHNKCVLC
jgi:hypothetical protein